MSEHYDTSSELLEQRCRRPAAHRASSDTRCAERMPSITDLNRTLSDVRCAPEEGVRSEANYPKRYVTSSGDCRTQVAQVNVEEACACNDVMASARRYLHKAHVALKTGIQDTTSYLRPGEEVACCFQERLDPAFNEACQLEAECSHRGQDVQPSPTDHKEKTKKIENTSWATPCTLCRASIT